MPVINMPLDLLLRLVNAERAVIAESQVGATLHDMGIEVDELTQTQSYGCGCENVIERTDAQGPPLHCPKCGTDFRTQPDSLRTLGASRVARLDMVAVRPDIFDAGGMARYMRGFLGVRPGLVEYPVAPPRLSVEVDAALSRDESYRPAIACAVIRNVHFDHERIKLLMNLQEDLHWALGRDRKLASIGVYDLGKVREDRPFRYRAVRPDEIRFTPLGFAADAAGGNRLTPAEILQRHKTGQAYRHLLSGFSAYPLLSDGHGAVLSMPPIINSEDTRVVRATRACFVDVTGLAQRTVDRALNILLSGLFEVAPEITIEAVTIHYPARRLVTPDFAPTLMQLSLRQTCDTLGLALDAAALRGLLERMGHGVSDSNDADVLQVRVPAWRNDIMHAVDLIEDAAVAYGYQNLTPALVPTFSIGVPRAIEEHSRLIRGIFIGLGFHQVMTLPLTSEAAAFEKWGLPPDPRCVRIAHPISSEQTICRVSLLPGILETLAINKQYDLPQKLVEVGDCSFLDPHSETGASERRFVAAAMIDTHVGYADARAVLDALARELERPMSVRPMAHPGFIPGRVAQVFNADGQPIGVMGELHPQVLENYGLRHAVAVLELDVSQQVPA